MSALDIPIRLSGALRIIEIAKVVLPRGIVSGQVAPAAADEINREFAKMVPFIDRSVMHSPEELRQISAQMKIVMELVDGLSEHLTPEEEARYSEGCDRLTGKFLKKLRAK